MRFDLGRATGLRAALGHNYHRTFTEGMGAKRGARSLGRHERVVRHGRRRLLRRFLGRRGPVVPQGLAQAPLHGRVPQGLPLGTGSEMGIQLRNMRRLAAVATKHARLL